MNRQNSNPSLVCQALTWLGRMSISYNDKGPTDFWSFTYNGSTIHIPKECGDNEIGFYMPVIIVTDADTDEKTFKLIFDFAFDFAKDTFAEANVEYCSKGLCLVSKWWGYKGRNKLYKYRFLEMLDTVCRLQAEIQFALEMAGQALFNPPKEIVEDIFKDSNSAECNA